MQALLIRLACVIVACLSLSPPSTPATIQTHLDTNKPKAINATKTDEKREKKKPLRKRLTQNQRLISEYRQILDDKSIVSYDNSIVLGRKGEGEGVGSVEFGRGGEGRGDR